MKRVGDTNETAKLMNEMSNNVDSTLKEAIDGGTGLAPDIHVSKTGFTAKDTAAQFKDTLVNEEKEQFNYQEEARRQQELVDVGRKGNTLLSAEDYLGVSPDIKVIGERRPEGLSSASISAPQVIDQTGAGDGGSIGRGATAVDLSKLDESMIMSMPFIKAASEIVPNILFLKPKDPVIRFHWVNFKNWEGGNYQKYLAIGFVNASPDDVDQEKTPVGENCIDGTQIKWYDVMLMKINVFKLMSLYKANIMSSLRMVGRFQQHAMSMAQKQFNDDIYNGLVDSGPNKGASLMSAFRRLKQSGGNIEFYVPGLDDKSDKDFFSGASDADFVSGAALNR